MLILEANIFCPDLYNRAQQALIPSIQRILTNIEEQTGLIGIFTVVGPQPIRGGNLGAVTSVNSLGIRYCLILTHVHLTELFTA